MVWSYVNPTTSSKDAVRFRIGDTDKDDPQLQDEEINYLLSLNSNIIRASVEGCKALAAKYAREVSKTVGPVSIQAQTMFEHYNNLATSLTGLLTSGSDVPIPWAGGVFKSDRKDIEDDDSLIPHTFTKRTLQPPEIQEDTIVSPA